MKFERNGFKYGLTGTKFCDKEKMMDSLKEAEPSTVDLIDVFFLDIFAPYTK